MSHKSVPSTTLEKILDDDIIDSTFFLESLSNPHLQLIESELRENGDYWKMTGATEPSESDVFTFIYFSTQAKLLVHIRDNLFEARNCNGMKFLQVAVNELDLLVSQGSQVKQLIEVAPDYERNIAINKDLEVVFEKAHRVKNLIEHAQYEIIGSELSIQTLSSINFWISDLDVSINSLYQLFQNICDEVYIEQV